MTANYFLKRWNAYESNQERLLWLKQNIKSMYSNKKLILFLDQFVSLIPDEAQKINVLLYTRKIVQQYPRIPDGEFLEAFEEEFAEEIERIEDEQQQYSPLKWIDFEVEYQQQILLQAKDAPVMYPNRIFQGEKEIMTMKEILKTFDISKSTLDRWRTEGMPIHKKGRKLFGYKKELVDWIEGNKNKKKK